MWTVETTAIVMLLAGLLGGLLSSAPLGVINLWITDKALAGTSRGLWWFIAGVVCADMAYAGVAAWGYHTFLQGSQAWPILEIVGGLLLVGLGVLNLRKKTEKPKREAMLGLTPWRDFAFGAFMCGSNPAFLMFWVFLVGEVETRLGLFPDELGTALFVVGTGVGDLLWFRLLLWLVNRGKRTAMAPRILAPARLVIACVFVVAGSVALYKGVHEVVAPPSGIPG